jgi:hypothetical protein
MPSSGDPLTNAVLDSCVNLAAPVWTNGAVQLTLNGESGVPYVIQSSPDLQNWTPVSTNNDTSITRFFALAAPEGAGFYRVSRAPLPLFAYALAAREGIALNGIGPATDSYNSADTNLSTNGQYDQTKTSTNGHVASIFGPVFLGNHSINGNLYLGPTATNLPSGNLVMGTIQHDFNACFPDAMPPDCASWIPAPSANTNIDGTIYQYAFFAPTNDYTITNSAYTTIYVAPNARVRLMVTAPAFALGLVRVAGLGSQAGALTLYQPSGSATLEYSLVDNGNTASCAYCGLAGVTNLSLIGQNFTGTIYAPSAALLANGGGNGPGFFGSCIVKSITLNGHYMFHFDENLLQAGPVR